MRLVLGAVLACILADAAAFSVGFVPSLHRKPAVSHQARPQGLSSAHQPRGRASRLGSAAAPWRASAATPQFAPAGGLPSSYAWEKQWYPIFLEEFQNDEDPFPFTLLGQQVVFWKDKVAGEWRCMADRCPHRLVPLSEGRVLDNGEIECPYHGWTFQGNTGECTSIPHAPDENWSKPRACGTALDVSVKQGIVWVWPEKLFNPPMFGEVRAKPDEGLIPTMDVLDEHKDAVMDDVFRDIPYDWSTYVENVLDVSHVTFTHHGTQGKREATKPFYFLELEPVTERGFELESVGPDRKPTGQGRNTKYVAPTYLHHTINFGAFLVYVATMAVPTKPGWCRIIGRFPIINAPEKLQKASKTIPTFMKHLKRLQVLEDDNIFLHVGERTQRTVLGGMPFVDGTVQSDKWAKANYQATEADKPVINLRKWFDSNLPVKWTQGTRLDLEPELSKEMLLDRWHSHTKNCNACLGAYKKVKLARLVAACAGAVAAVAGRLVTDLMFPKLKAISAMLSLAVAGLFALGWSKLGVLESRFITGPYPPTRNVKPKEDGLSWQSLLSKSAKDKSATESKNVNVFGKGAGADYQRKEA